MMLRRGAWGWGRIQAQSCVLGQITGQTPWACHGCVIVEEGSDGVSVFKLSDYDCFCSLGSCWRLEEVHMSKSL